jgi:hypothetical protein
LDWSRCRSKSKVFDNVLWVQPTLNRLVSNKKPENFDNLYIPGFNRTYDGDFGVGLNYTVSYFIPIYKKKVIPVEVPKKTRKNVCLKFDKHIVKIRFAYLKSFIYRQRLVKLLYLK